MIEIKKLKTCFTNLMKLYEFEKNSQEIEDMEEFGESFVLDTIHLDPRTYNFHKIEQLDKKFIDEFLENNGKYNGNQSDGEPRYGVNIKLVPFFAIIEALNIALFDNYVSEDMKRYNTLKLNNIIKI